MKGNQKVFITQVSVGSEKNWYFLARQQKFIQGINSPLAPYASSVILPCYLISKLRPQIPPGRSLSFHSLKTRDLLPHSRNTYILLLYHRAGVLWRIINTPLLARTPSDRRHAGSPQAVGMPSPGGSLQSSLAATITARCSSF